LKTSRKYVAAVALLAVLAVVFSVFGTVAPPLAEEAKPQQTSGPSSDSVGHFQNPPTYDSGWVDIQNKKGQNFNITHNLNSTEVVVDITGKRTLTSGEHCINFGLMGEVRTPGLNRTYGGASTDQASSVVQTSDGGYAIAGYTNSYGAGSDDFWLVKTDSSGNKLWNKTYGGTLIDHAYSMVQTLDGGYAMAGYTQSYGVGGTDFWLVKADASGSKVWNKTYGGTGNDAAYSVIQTSDGGYALAGYTFSYGAGGPDYWLVKVDSTGAKQWDRTYGGTANDWAFSVVQTSDGGYAIAGNTNSYGAGNFDIWLVKTDASGIMQWNKTYGGVSYEISWSVVQTGDGGYAMAGYTQSYGAGYYDAWLVKTDSSGNKLWNQTYGGTNDDRVYSLIQTVDGGYALAGYTASYGAGGDVWLVETDASGTALWNKTYGGNSNDQGNCVVQRSDGVCVIAGYTYSYGTGNCDFYLVSNDVILAGLAWVDSTSNTITLYRGATDLCWNYVRVRMWLLKEPTWIYGDINMDGVVDAKDLYILSRNYGKTFSLLSLTGIIAIAGVHTVKKRKQPKQPSYIS
jgi:hypothetical protein